jgi:hypothetical protein
MRLSGYGKRDLLGLCEFHGMDVWERHFTKGPQQQSSTRTGCGPLFAGSPAAILRGVDPKGVKRSAPLPDRFSASTSLAMLRTFRTVVVFVAWGFALAIGFFFVGGVTGWLNPHDPHGPDWWRESYLVGAMCLTPALAAVAASRAWRKWAAKAARERLFTRAADFRVRYRFRTAAEGGRGDPPRQGMRCDFLYAQEDPRRDPVHYIWPEFEDAAGLPLPQSELVPISGSALMYVIDDSERSLHASKIRRGIRGRFVEGDRVVADLEVVDVLSLGT